jgi:integrase
LKSQKAAQELGVADRRKFSKKVVEDLPVPPPGKRKDYYDTEVPKLLVRVTSRGGKAFYVRKHKDGGTDRVLIGTFPEVTVEQARKSAMELAAALVRGDDPHEKRIKARLEITLGELLDTYIEQHGKNHCLAWKEMQAVFRRYLLSWRERRIGSITRAEVASRMNQIKIDHGAVPANHTITYARAALNWCKNNGLLERDNPWVGATKFKIQPRERFLKPDEIGRFFKALKVMDNQKGFRDYIYLSLFTGARRANVLAMRWDQIDFQLGTWTIPRTKSGDSQIIPLTKAATEILTQRDAVKASEWVFPGEGGTGHVVEPKKAWKNLLEDAEISNLRLHDLRRTLGSYMAMGNQSLHMIGKVLGHKSPTATQIYSRFTHDPLRAAMEKAHTDMLHAAEDAVEQAH